MRWRVEKWDVLGWTMSLNKAGYPRTVTEVHSLLLNYQPTYKYNRKYQYQGVTNQLMFTHSGRLAMMKVKQKTINRTPEETLITSSVMIVEKKVIIQETVNYLHRQRSKRMQKHYEKLTKENMVTIPPME